MRNDEVSAEQVAALRPEALILSPGPGRPEDAGNMPEIFSQMLTLCPILGVCLGHQMIGQHFGAEIVRSPEIVHGKATSVTHDGTTFFQGLPNPFPAGRYHSLTIQPGSLPEPLVVSARTDQGEIMGIRHRSLPVEGVQFHPESILTPDGEKLLRNFVDLIRLARRQASAPSA